MEERIEDLETKYEEMEGKLDDIYNIIVGPKLDLGMGFMSRIAILQKNIEYLTIKFNEFENKSKLDKESTKIKLGIIWYLAGTVTSGLVLYLINLALNHK